MWLINPRKLAYIEVGTMFPSRLVEGLVSELKSIGTRTCNMSGLKIQSNWIHVSSYFRIENVR